MPTILNACPTLQSSRAWDFAENIRLSSDGASYRRITYPTPSTVISFPRPSPAANSMTARLMPRSTSLQTYNTPSAFTLRSSLLDDLLVFLRYFHNLVFTASGTLRSIISANSTPSISSVHSPR